MEIKIEENDPYLKGSNIIDDKDRLTQLHLPGVPFASQLYKAPDDSGGTPREITSLYFGNWKGANMAKGSYIPYPFIHKKHGPYIENFVVAITASPSVTNEIIKKINWEKLNEAITK